MQSNYEASYYNNEYLLTCLKLRLIDNLFNI